MRGKLPKAINLPASITVPFGSFEEVLSQASNKQIKKQLDAAIKDIPVEKAEEALSKCRELVMQVCLQPCLPAPPAQGAAPRPCYAIMHCTLHAAREFCFKVANLSIVFLTRYLCFVLLFVLQCLRTDTSGLQPSCKLLFLRHASMQFTDKCSACCVVDSVPATVAESCVRVCRWRSLSSW